MAKVSRYILINFFHTFLSLFFTLFFLASVIFFIKISSLTSLFSVTFSDLGEAYLYVLPQIVVYTLPVTFFIALAMSIFKLSNDNEMIVLFALTLSPNKIAKLFFLISLSTSIFLLANSVIFIPIAKQLNKNFIEYKKLQSKINIKATSYGQKFENWSVYINSAKNNRYSDIVLYNRDPKKSDEDKFIIAKSANIDKNGSSIIIKLENGKLYNIHKKSLDELSYNKMNMSYKPNIKHLKFATVYDYWQQAKVNKQRAKDLSINVLISFFPLATFLFALSFGIANTRHEKPNIYLYMFLVVLVFYLLMYGVSLTFPLYGTVIMLLLFHLASGLYFKKHILKRY